jgi:hypothetical protein
MLYSVIWREFLNLPNEFLTSNSITLANSITNLSIKDEYGLFSTQYKTCVNIPTELVLHIMESFLNFNNKQTT